MMNTIFALSMVAGIGLTTGTPIIGARVAVVPQNISQFLGNGDPGAGLASTEDSCPVAR